MNVFGKGLTTGVAGVGAAFASALCCAGPILAVAIGVSGAGLASTFDPLRPYFLGATALFLGLGFFLLHREEKNACEPDKVCADPRVRRRMKIMLWTATVIAVVFASFPSWQNLVL
ncbi:MAG: mercuric transporter MerT family protein [Gemmatimonadota bacterium]